MNKVNWLIGLSVIVTFMGCSSEPNEYDVDNYTLISNPASVYCVQKGGKLRAFTENDVRVMYCVFSEDEKYEQWEYYNEHHK